MLFRKEPKRELIVGLDIGSSAVRLVAGQMLQSDMGKPHPEIQIIGAAEVVSEGVQRGVVTSIEELISSISGALEQVERMVGVPVESAWVGVNGPFLLTHASKGVVAVAKTNGEVAPEDVERVVSAARAVPLPLNYDLLHVLPRSFAVDNQSGIKDPVGMTGMRLEVDTTLVYAMSTHVKNVSRAVYRTGLDIDDVVLSILAAGEAVVTTRQKELGVVVVNIGATTTSIAMYEEGDTIHVAVLPIGSQHITNDIAVGLRVSIEVAERIKVEYGHAVPKEVSKKDIIDMASVGGNPEEVASRHYVSQIIEARVAEICDKVRLEIGKVPHLTQFPAGVVAIGGGAKIGGFVECAKNELRLPVALGYPYDVSSIASVNADLGFVSAIGLLRWGAMLDTHPQSRVSPISKANSLFQKMGKVKEWLMP
ncbi:MAG: cell division protein FtsA [Candidatus Magasanikbacteria bacterium]|nr:cell division protein FtsA [Candidatus Magasanikbacteria bacterium]